MHEAVKALPASVWKTHKLNALQQFIEAAAGLSVEAFTVSEKAVQGDSISFTCAINNRSTAIVTLQDIVVPGQSFSKQVGQQLIQNKNYNYAVNMLPVVAKNDFQPYWLQQPKKSDGMFLVNDYHVLGKAWNDPAISVQFNCKIEGVVFSITRPVLHKYVDLVKGECVQPFILIPPYELVVKPNVVLTNVLSEKGKKNPATPLQLTVVSNQEKQMNAVVRYKLVDQKTGKAVYEKGVDSVFKDAKTGTIEVPFASIYNSTIESNALTAFVAVTNSKGTQHYNEHLQKIVYDHIPNTHYLTQDIVKVVDEPIRIKGSKVGYIAGSGDLTEEALVQLGFRVEKITAANCTLQYLAGFDAIVTGVRAYNVNAFLKISDLSNIDNAIYTGYVEGKNLDISKFVNFKSIGNSNFKLDINGRGFTSKYLNSQVTGKIEEISFNNKIFQIMSDRNLLNSKDTCFNIPGRVFAEGAEPPEAITTSRTARGGALTP